MLWRGGAGQVLQEEGGRGGCRYEAGRYRLRLLAATQRRCATLASLAQLLQVIDNFLDSQLVLHVVLAYVAGGAAAAASLGDVVARQLGSVQFDKVLGNVPRTAVHKVTC